MNNSKYFTADLIYNRIARVYKNKIREFNISNFIEWCATVEIEYIGSFEQFVPVSNHKLTVQNRRAKLPCNIYTIQDVMDGDDRVYNYRNNGVYLFFDNHNYVDGKKIEINYLGIAIDEDSGLPLHLRGHEAACEHYCLHHMLAEDYLLGKIPENKYERISRNFDDAVDAAKSSHRHVSADERHQFLAAMANMIHNPNFIPFKNNVTE
jgi:hypothetical protein